MSTPNTLLNPSVDDLMAFENGQLSQDEIVALFQRLVDTGLAWQLQGAYGRAAMSLIEQGMVHPTLH